MISREISKLDKKFKLQVKSILCLLLILIQSSNLTAVLATLRPSFTDHFQQDKFITFNLLTRFQGSTRLQFGIYYHVKRLTMEEKLLLQFNTSVLSPSKGYLCKEFFDLLLKYRLWTFPRLYR